MYTPPSAPRINLTPTPSVRDDIHPSVIVRGWEGGAGREVVRPFAPPHCPRASFFAKTEPLSFPPRYHLALARAAVVVAGLVWPLISASSFTTRQPSALQLSLSRRPRWHDHCQGHTRELGSPQLVALRKGWGWGLRTPQTPPTLEDMICRGKQILQESKRLPLSDDDDALD